MHISIASLGYAFREFTRAGSCVDSHDAVSAVPLGLQRGTKRSEVKPANTSMQGTPSAAAMCCPAES